MAPADWTERDREFIDDNYEIWKRQKGVTYRAGVVMGTARGCGDLAGDPDAWFESKWERQIGRYASPTLRSRFHGRAYVTNLRSNP